MAYSIWMLEESNITVSGGVSLDGVTQGDGSHLPGQTITLNNNNWLETFIRDDDNDFDDNDNNQVLDGDQVIDGVSYTDGTRIEAEYEITLRDPNTGITYRAFGYNVNNSSPSYATIEGLAFEGGAAGFPPIGVALEVVDSFEGPGATGRPPIDADDTAFPPCFVAGTLIATATGLRPVEEVRSGDLIVTRDHGTQPVRWAGQSAVGATRLEAIPAFRPVRIRAGALGSGLPKRDLWVSQQHRLLLTGWRAELLFGDPEVLIAARHLIDDRAVTLDRAVTGVTYVHLLFEAHEIIFAEGVETESFLPGAGTLSRMEAALRAELLALFPDLATDTTGPITPARRLLQGWEGRMVAA